MWSAWDLDHVTWGWIVWLSFGFVWEVYALIWHRGEQLTTHLRPVFTASDLAYFLAVALWMWLGYHFLVDELWVGQAIKR